MGSKGMLLEVFLALLELESQPGGDVVHIFARLSLLQKVTREEMRVCSRERQMPLDLPLDQPLDLIPDFTGTTGAC